VTSKLPRWALLGPLLVLIGASAGEIWASTSNFRVSGSEIEAIRGDIRASASDDPLVDAAKNSDAAGLQALLDEGADVNVQTADGSTALLWASYRDDLESARLLIRAGADVNIANELGATPIWAASRNGSAAVAAELLAAGADPDSPLLLGETPLVTASRTGNSDVVQMLLEKGAAVNARGARGQTPLMFAAAQRHPDVVRVLLDHGADVNAVSDSWSQLMAQAPHAHPEHQAWVEHGGNTALMFAARVGDLESAKHLVAAGADVDAPSAWGTTPLAVATYADFGEQFLIREQTTRQVVYFDREKILAGQFAEVVEFLLEQGADPNAGAHRFTPLIAALLRRHEETVALLLDHGADPNLALGDFTPHQRGSTTDFYIHKAWVGATPLWLAARYSTSDVVRRLLEHGADPLFEHHGVYYAGGSGGELSPRQEDITTTLMAAVGMGTGRAWTVVEPDEADVFDAVKLLVEAGVDLNAVGNARNRGVGGASTALEAAIELGYDLVAEFLRDEGAIGPSEAGSPR
jgi:ankyrin repeat protein